MCEELAVLVCQPVPLFESRVGEVWVKVGRLGRGGFLVWSRVVMAMVVCFLLV